MHSVKLVLFCVALYAVRVFSDPAAGHLVYERSIEKRKVCNQDNVFRALIDPRYSKSASIFCSAFISVPPSIVTAATSTVRRGTISRSTTSTAVPDTTTITPVVTSTSMVSTFTSTVYTTYRALDEDPDPNPPYPQKRDIPLPSYVAQFPSSRVSSACSCITVFISTTTLTPFTTVPATTMTIVTIITPSPETVTHTPTTTVVLSTRTVYRVLPTLCDPVQFEDYLYFVDSRTFKYNTLPVTTKQDCCLTYYNAKKCLAFEFNSNFNNCGYFTGTSQTDFTYKVDICPLGVTSGSHEEAPGFNGVPQNYGPYLDAAPLGNH